MRWRVMVALTGMDGTVHTHEVTAGANATIMAPGTAYSSSPAFIA